MKQVTFMFNKNRSKTRKGKKSNNSKRWSREAARKRWGSRRGGGGGVAVKVQTHLRENKGEEVKLWHVIKKQDRERQRETTRAKWADEEDSQRIVSPWRSKRGEGGLEKKSKGWYFGEISAWRDKRCLWKKGLDDWVGLGRKREKNIKARQKWHGMSALLQMLR